MFRKMEAGLLAGNRGMFMNVQCSRPQRFVSPRTLRKKNRHLKKYPKRISFKRRQLPLPGEGLFFHNLNNFRVGNRPVFIYLGNTDEISAIRVV